MDQRSTYPLSAYAPTAPAYDGAAVPSAPPLDAYDALTMPSNAGPAASGQAPVYHIPHDPDAQYRGPIPLSPHAALRQVGVAQRPPQRSSHSPQRSPQSSPRSAPRGSSGALSAAQKRDRLALLFMQLTGRQADKAWFDRLYDQLVADELSLNMAALSIRHSPQGKAWRAQVQAYVVEVFRVYGRRTVDPESDEVRLYVDHVTTGRMSLDGVEAQVGALTLPSVPQ